jgi:hypothetical protein
MKPNSQIVSRSGCFYLDSDQSLDGRYRFAIGGGDACTRASHLEPFGASRSNTAVSPIVAGELIGNEQVPHCASKTGTPQQQLQL